MNNKQSKSKLSDEEWLIKFMEVKTKLVLAKEEEGTVFMTEADWIDLRAMSTEDKKEIKDAIKEALIMLKYDITCVDDDDICPWCVRQIYCRDNGEDCSGCGYGERHGICRELPSDYQILVKGKKNSLVDRIVGSIGEFEFLISKEEGDRGIAASEIKEILETSERS